MFQKLADLQNRADTIPLDISKLNSLADLNQLDQLADETIELYNAAIYEENETYAKYYKSVYNVVYNKMGKIKKIANN